MNTHNYGPDNLAPGHVVWTHPATDAFMQGDTRGMVTKVGRKLIHVRMTVSGRVRKFSREYLAHDSDNGSAALWRSSEAGQ